jgi:hypothetical protein
MPAARRARGRRRAGAPRTPSAPLQRAVHGGLAGVEHRRGLAGAEPEHVAQDEDRALGRGQVLEARDEGERDGLARLVARLGAGGRVGDGLEQDVGIWLQPDRLGTLRRVPDSPPARVAQGVEAAVGRDSVQPGAHGGPFLELVQRAPRRKQRLLQQVLGVLERAEDPVAVQLELTPVGVRELPEGVFVAAAGTGQLCRVHHPLGHRGGRKLIAQFSAAPVPEEP